MNEGENRYAGKRFSILGDSISTLEGYNPDGYALFYTGDACKRTGVRENKDTWWGKIIGHLGGELLVNSSWAGSPVTELPCRDKQLPEGCSGKRTGGLHRGPAMPDVIIVHLGTRDWVNGAAVDTAGIEKVSYIGQDGLVRERYLADDMGIFASAYAKMLNRLNQIYPAAEIFCCTLSETMIYSDPSFRFPYCCGGTHIQQYNAVIRRCVRAAGCKLIDLYNGHTPYDTVDGFHPTARGMHTLAAQVLEAICGGGKANGLEPNRHTKRLWDIFGGIWTISSENDPFGRPCTNRLFPLEKGSVCVADSSTALRIDKISQDGCTVAIQRPAGVKTQGCYGKEGLEKRFIRWGDRTEIPPDPDAFTRTFRLSICINPMTDFSTKGRVVGFSISDGGDPVAHYYQYRAGKLEGCNKINGSRDGGRSFPDGFFDKMAVKLDQRQKDAVLQMLDPTGFSTWKMDYQIAERFDCPGFCVHWSFSCEFEDGSEFVYYPAGEVPDACKRLIQFCRAICPLPELYTGFV